MNKQEQKDKCREILNQYQLQETLVPEDFAFMYNIFKNHRDWESKRGCGVSSIAVKKSSYGTRCFWIIRDDGTEIDISYKESINPTVEKKETLIKRACRNAVEPVILQFRKDNNVSDEYVVHHRKISFSKIVENWLSENDMIDLLSNISSDGITTSFTSESRKNDFVDFHNFHAVLVGITEEEHKIIHTKNYKTTPKKKKDDYENI